jgi:hypothetical protein
VSGLCSGSCCNECAKPSYRDLVFIKTEVTYSCRIIHISRQRITSGIVASEEHSTTDQWAIAAIVITARATYSGQRDAAKHLPIINIQRRVDRIVVSIHPASSPEVENQSGEAE